MNTKSPTELRNLIVSYYEKNPDTVLSAMEVATKFNYRPELHPTKRAKAVRDLKRVAKGTRVLKSRSKSHVYTEPVESSQYHHNIDKEELSVSAVFTEKPRSPQEIIELHRIDTNVWKLSQYWSKEKSSGWQVSAMFVAKKPEDLTTEELLSELTSIFTDDSFVTYKIPTVANNKKALMVYLSDKHIGADTKEDAIYDNEYNRKVVRQRLAGVYNKILEATTMFGQFEDIYICDLGDTMDGWNGYTTRGGHKLPQNMSNKEAFMTFIQEHKIFFDKLFMSEFASNYHVVSQTNDNHGGDYTYIANQALNLYINTAFPEVEVVVMTKFLDHFTYGLHTFILTHGKDSEDLKSGLPLQLNAKTENFINKYIQYHKIDTDLPIHVIKGDLHSESQQLGLNFRYRNVLSMYGSSKWTMSNFGPNHAGVSFDIVQKNAKGVYSFYLLFDLKGKSH